MKTIIVAIIAMLLAVSAYAAEDATYERQLRKNADYEKCEDR